MGRRKGSVVRLKRIGVLDQQHLEMAVRLVEAYPNVLPHGQGHHISTGEWASREAAANTVSRLRQVLGFDAIRTVKNSGYQAAADLASLLAKFIGDE